MAKKLKKPEDHPKLAHARKITHRSAEGKFKEPPGAGTRQGKIAPKDPPASGKS